jgi:hypothetical protein
MIIWGGSAIRDCKDGTTYDPKTNKWTKIGKAPVGGSYFNSAIWTGEKMIILGRLDWWYGWNML